MRVIMFIFVLLLLILGCGKGGVVVFCAGSLTKPFERLAAEFKLRYGVSVRVESSGSRVAAKKITELGRKADVVALADWRLFPQMLYPKHCVWYAKFATNRLVLAFTKRSHKSEKINPNNWATILAESETRWGHADPDADPCGYRALLALQLAEKFYRKKGLYNLLLNHRRRVIRPKSVELVALLQAGELDYAFQYVSVALQHRLKFIELPPQLNFGDIKYADFYKQAKLKLSDSTVVVGEPIFYGVGILKDAPHPKMALSFVKLLLSDTGRKIFKECAQPQIKPTIFVGEAPKNLLKKD